jgi:hypothetical protein
VDAPFNKFIVGAEMGGDAIVILNLPITHRRGRGSMPDFPVPAPLTKSEALTLAAWLVAVTGERAVFLEMLDAIEAT